jgi:HSP20 family protein
MFWKHHPGHRHGAGQHQGQRRGHRWGYRRPKYNIPVNIVEADKEYTLTLHAPTYAKENIKLSVMGEMLYITGTREPEDLHPNFILQEYPIKSFERSFELSHKADKNNIKASYKDGVLTVVVGKTKAAQEPEVDIEIS